VPDDSPENPYVGSHRRPEELTEGEAEPQPEEPAPTAPQAPLEEKSEPEPEGEMPAEESPSEPFPASGRKPQVVPGQYYFLKRGTFVLVTAAVWIPGALVGLGLYYYWLHSVHKAVPVFVVLIYLVTCALAGLLLAMVERRPVVAAVSLAVMSAPLASTAAAAALYGAYVFHWLRM
jgi:hypothetical protein